MTEQEIKIIIERLISENYFIWTIGVTDNATLLKRVHDKPTSWNYWDAGTEEVARRIEKYFLDKGCKGVGGGDINPTYIYIF